MRTLLLSLLLVGCSQSALLQLDDAASSSSERSGQGLVFSEILSADHGLKYVELCNRSSMPISLQDVTLERYANGSNNGAFEPLPAVELPPGQAFVITAARDRFVEVYGFEPDLDSPVASGNGNDAFLLSTQGVAFDAIGVPGRDGRALAWNYKDRSLVRSLGATASAEWLEADWTGVDLAQATPGTCGAPQGPPAGSLVLNEVADLQGAVKYVSICNPSNVPVPLAGYALGLNVNQSAHTSWQDLSDRVLQPGEAHVVVRTGGAADFASLYGPAHQASDVVNGNGNDVYTLVDAQGTLLDRFGWVGQSSDGWDYSDQTARRVAPAFSGTFEPSDWVVVPRTEGLPFDCSTVLEAPTEPDPTEPDPTEPEPTEPDPTEPEPTEQFQDEAFCSGLAGTRSGATLRSIVADQAHISCGYNTARRFMFGELFNEGGVVYGRYSDATANASYSTAAGDLNTEHIWPQSQGAGGGRARCDLNHLMPTSTFVNAVRSSYPFGDVAFATWSNGYSSLGDSADNETVFEPPDDVKGDIARALFYMHATYGFSMDSGYRERMRAWNAADPVDAGERNRSERIAAELGSGNVLVSCPSWVDRL